jgi:enoyl-CoA hydratase
MCALAPPDRGRSLNEVAIKLTVPQFAIELARYRLTPPGLARLATAAMFGPEVAAQFGYLGYVVDAAELDVAVAREVGRLKTLDWRAFEATKQRLSGPVLSAIASAAAGYRPPSQPL